MPSSRPVRIINGVTVLIGMAGCVGVAEFARELYSLECEVIPLVDTNHDGSVDSSELEQFCIVTGIRAKPSSIRECPAQMLDYLDYSRRGVGSYPLLHFLWS